MPPFPLYVWASGFSRPALRNLIALWGWPGGMDVFESDEAYYAAPAAKEAHAEQTHSASATEKQ